MHVLGGVDGDNASAVRGGEWRVTGDGERLGGTKDERQKTNDERRKTKGSFERWGREEREAVTSRRG